MPTGYTADIKDGIDFKTFAMNCARAFDACVELRDDPPGGDKIPNEFVPSDYHEKKLSETREKIVELGAMSKGDRQAAADKEWEESEEYRLARLKEMSDLRKAYNKMLSEVNSWKPPTPEHVVLRDFMIQQITDSIKWDCAEEAYAEPLPRMSGDEWYSKQLFRLAKDSVYHEKKHKEEVLRAESRTKWVQDLRKSLERRGDT